MSLLKEYSRERETRPDYGEAVRRILDSPLGNPHRPVRRRYRLRRWFGFMLCLLLLQPAGAVTESVVPGQDDLLHAEEPGICGLDGEDCLGAVPALPGVVLPQSVPFWNDLRPLFPDDVDDVVSGAKELLPLLGEHLPGVPNATVSVHADVSINFGVAGHTFGANESVEVEHSTNASREVPPPQEGQMSCRDARGCPDLVVDPSRMLMGTIREETFPVDDCNVAEGSTEPGTRRLVRFTLAVPNFGEGDLMVGTPGDPRWFEWGECHGHWHFREFADYRLWTPEGYLSWREARDNDPNATASETFEGHPNLHDHLVTGAKQGFCLVDIVPYVPLEPSKYHSCGSNQGITRGWADQYSFSLDGQFVDVTGVPSGLYVLEAEINPERLIQEQDYANNAGAILLFLPPP